MSIIAEVRLVVRQRAGFVCEYCGVSETDSGGELTIDHIRPQAKAGSDDP
jgi:5-methylcytosine-specific restriction endonuclease McrA